MIWLKLQLVMNVLIKYMNILFPYLQTRKMQNALNNFLGYTNV